MARAGPGPDRSIVATLRATYGAKAALDRSDSVRNGGRRFFCGNGGNAADSPHMATEYVVRDKRECRAIAVIALTTDTSLLTAAANDYDVELLSARQVEAVCRRGDLLILHTTSGNSSNLLKAAEAAKKKRVVTLALSVKGGGRIAAIVDDCIVVPTTRTDRAQEIQLAIEHAVCEMVDKEVFADQ